MIEVGVLFYAVSLVVAVAIGWFARVAFREDLRTRGSASSSGQTRRPPPDAGQRGARPCNRW